MNIVTITLNPAVDVSMSIKQMLAERKLRSSRPVYEAGGGGINVSRVIKIMGEESLAIYTAGGTSGELFQKLLDQEGIKQHCIHIKNRTREDLAIREDSSGQLFRVVTPGPEINVQEQESILEQIGNLPVTPDFTVISGSLPPGMPPSCCIRIIKLMKSKGSRVILDTKARNLKQIVKKEGVFLLKPNINELSELTGKEITQEADQETAARELVKKSRSEYVVVSLGAAGVILVSQDKVERFRAPTVSIKSRVGAGDSTVAGITLGLSRGYSISKSVQYGIAAGTAAVMTPGTQLCRREDVKHIFSQMNA